MTLVLSIIFFLLLPYSEARNITSGKNDQNAYKFCKPIFCSPEGPRIRFPFRLINQPKFCGPEGFELSCSGNKTLLHLPFSGDYYVQKIDYLRNTVTIMDVNETPCSLQSLHSPNFSESRFFTRLRQKNYTLVNCTERLSPSFLFAAGPICVSDETNLFYATNHWTPGSRLPSTCSVYGKFSILDVADRTLFDDDTIVRAFTARSIDIEWNAIDGCYGCEKSGKFCGFNTASNSTICVGHKCKILNVSLFFLRVLFKIFFFEVE